MDNLLASKNQTKRKMKKIKRSICLLAAAVSLLAGLPALAQQKAKPNILFIAVDDLKPVLGCYGDKLIQTPNIDRLAKMGTVFLSNYCQQAVCGPTRASIMTGKRPDYTQIWDLKTQMRDINPDIVTIPQYFIGQGYTTAGIGKIYHPTSIDKQNDLPSWSIPYLKAGEHDFAAGWGEPILVGGYQSPQTKLLVKKYMKEAAAKGLKDSASRAYVAKFIKLSSECIDAPDNAYEDGADALLAKRQMAEMSKGKKPFFMAVGFHRPHLPFVAPKKYWDLYNRADMPIAPFQHPSKNGVAMAYHNVGELTAYTDIEPLANEGDQKNGGLTLAIDQQKKLIHGYYASVSYTDAQVGILLNTLDSLGITNSTIIVLWGDHGWHLGDHNLWCKHTDFEQATHAPLLIAAPGIKHTTTASATEFVDVFPTLCDLAGVKIPTNLDGKSLVPLMKNSAASVKDFSVSQYPRSDTASETQRLGFADAKVMGYSIRTKQYRFTIWMKDFFRSTEPFNKALVAGSELYDYKKDPNETVNVVNDKKYAAVYADMYQKMLRFFTSQEKK